MRDIEFRGRRLENGKWIFGSLLNFNGYYEIADWNTVDCGRYDVDPATVGQYTGFMDKNAIKVYEGDVLTDKFESIGVVEWQNGCFVVNFGDVDVFQISDCFDDSYQMWVIGNVHNNPELLK